jgi:hypothetical protein
VTAALQCPGDAQLVLARDPGDYDAVAVDQLTKCSVVGGQVGADDDELAGVEQTDLGSDGPGGGGVIAGHHRDPDPGAPARRHCVGRAVPGPVLQRDQAQKVRVPLGVLGRGR